MRSVVDCIKTKQQMSRHKKSLNLAIKTADGAALRPVEVNYNNILTTCTKLHNKNLLIFCRLCNYFHDARNVVVVHVNLFVSIVYRF